MRIHQTRSQLASFSSVVVAATLFFAPTAGAAEAEADVGADGDDGPASVEVTVANSPVTSDTVTPVAAPTTPDDSFVPFAANAAFTFKTPLATDPPAPQSLSGYAVARELVTNADYQAFVVATGHAPPPGWTSDGAVPVGLATHPVVQVSRADAEAYAAWESTLAPGWTVRLPTEAELENAARGKADRTFPWGDDADVSYDAESGSIDAPLDFAGVVTADYLRMYGDDATSMLLGASNGGGVEELALDQLLSESEDGAVYGWSLDGGSSGFVHTELYAETLGLLGYTTAVGSFAATPEGLDDMAGNVWEWTESTRLVPTSKGGVTTTAAVRGGAWSSDLSSCTTSYRGEGRDPAGVFADVGFRLVASPTPAT